MQAIEVDFEVYKTLTNLRRSESDTYNDVLRRHFNLGERMSGANGRRSENRNYLACRGGSIEIGTLLRAKHGGTLYEARVTDRGIEVLGKYYGSPSEAASSQTGYPTNGWHFWEAKPPGAEGWRSLVALR